MMDYQEYATEELILVSLDSVFKKKRKCSFGDLVKESFTLFPKVFALSQFPNWPDSLKLARPLRKLREKGFITGSPTTYYLLTQFGKKAVEAIKSKQAKGKPLDIKIRKTRDPDSAIIQDLIESEDFKNFVENKREYKSNNMKVREIVKSTLEAPLKEVKSNLDYLVKLAKKHGNNDLIDYLNVHINFLKNTKK